MEIIQKIYLQSWGHPHFVAYTFNNTAYSWHEALNRFKKFSTYRLEDWHRSFEEIDMKDPYVVISETAVFSGSFRFRCQLTGFFTQRTIYENDELGVTLDNFHFATLFETYFTQFAARKFAALVQSGIYDLLKFFTRMENFQRILFDGIDTRAYEQDSEGLGLVNIFTFVWMALKGEREVNDQVNSDAVVNGHTPRHYSLYRNHTMGTFTPCKLQDTVVVWELFIGLVVLALTSFLLELRGKIYIKIRRCLTHMKKGAVKCKQCFRKKKQIEF